MIDSKQLCADLKALVVEKVEVKDHLEEEVVEHQAPPPLARCQSKELHPKI